MYFATLVAQAESHPPFPPFSFISHSPSENLQGRRWVKLGVSISLQQKLSTPDQNGIWGGGWFPKLHCQIRALHLNREFAIAGSGRKVEQGVSSARTNLNVRVPPWHEMTLAWSRNSRQRDERAVAATPFVTYNRRCCYSTI